MKSKFLTILIATAWIGSSEFLRNQILFTSYWTNHYKNLGLDFPTAPINGAVWGVWSLAFAILIYKINQKFSPTETLIICWAFGFLLMWLTIGNLGVLPYKLLFFAVPLSILEVYVATIIYSKNKENEH